MQQPGSSTSGGAGGLISFDFIPLCLRPGGIIEPPEFELFPAVLYRANEWLQSNGHLQICTCETVELVAKPNGSTSLVESLTKLSGYLGSLYVRTLRLWLQPRSDGAVVVQQIGYYNVLPLISLSGGTSEKLDALVARSNYLFATNPVPGRIMAIQTVTLQVKPGSVQPDITTWSETGGFLESYTQMIRIFFVVGPPAYDSIGLADFVPAVSDNGSYRVPRVERFPVVLDRVNAWLTQQRPSGFRLTNIQTLLYKQKWSENMDTLQMLYVEGDIYPFYTRYIRVVFVVSGKPSLPSSPSNVRGPLTTKLFVPEMLESPGCCNPGTFENQIQLRQRLDEWMKATAARVVGIETLSMRIFSGAEFAEGFDTMHTWNGWAFRVQHGGRRMLGHHQHHPHMGHYHHHHQFHTSNMYPRRVTEWFLTLYRVYLDGAFQDPPGFSQSASIEDYMRRRANVCCGCCCCCYCTIL